MLQRCAVRRPQPGSRIWTRNLRLLRHVVEGCRRRPTAGLFGPVPPNGRQEPSPGVWGRGRRGNTLLNFLRATQEEIFRWFADRKSAQSRQFSCPGFFPTYRWLFRREEIAAGTGRTTLLNPCRESAEEISASAGHRGLGAAQFRPPVPWCASIHDFTETLPRPARNFIA